MAYDTALAQKRYTRFKSALTRAINSGNSHKVLAECVRFFHYYESSVEPMPDYWHRWERAQEDARFALQRAQ